MSGQAKMKGRKTVSRRLTEDIEEEMPTPTESLTDLFEIFIKAKEIEGLRERTLIDHKTHFKYFNTYLNDFHPSLKCASEVTTEILRSYIHFLKHEKGIWDNHQWLADKYAHQKGLSPVTINVRLRSLKCFLKFLFDEGYLQENPAARIKLLKTEKDTIESFSEEQISKLLKQPDQRTFAGFRDYVLMLFMLDTGIRVREALNLQANNFSYEQKTIIVPAHVAKNNQARILPLSQRTAKCIKLLIKEDTIFEDVAEIFFLLIMEKS
ncbi:tyrosine-type recombinase/integrase [Aneurinibacillus sp. Ricciae_BoGa-3]|nr:tyrosine-type recombinase/integrase [Aneurinibacillus sp. Ricciae_BoGa-3]WCK54742.1 tyrosine-type recombinase/integrase [Aneurinibacillus sp. Ricciae_BoGa-3]